jgi:hypothetical protein
MESSYLMSSLLDIGTKDFFRTNELPPEGFFAK